MRQTLILFFLLCSASYSDTLLTFTLSWDAPATGVVTGYNIYMGEQSALGEGDELDLRLYAGHVHLGNQLSVPVFLTHPETYFTITAVNDLGEGAPSNELLVKNDGSLRQVKAPVRR